MNRRMGLDRGDGEMLLVREVFSTLQGEGPSVGTPATFVRLGGCNLACSFCDTDFDHDRSTLRTISDVVAEAEEMRNRLVVLTGGEPLRQNVEPLCDSLRAAGMRVEVETSGSALSGELPAHVDVVLSPKTPRVIDELAQRAVAWKYVVGADAKVDDDGLPVVDFQSTGRVQRLARPPSRILSLSPERVFLQPLDDGNPLAAAARCVKLCKQHGYRLSLQTHKLLGLP